MKAQHKTLPDGTGAGHGWILAGKLRKVNWVMDENEQWKQQQPVLHSHGWVSTCVGNIKLECYFLFYSRPFSLPLTVIFPLMLLFPLFVLVHDPICVA